MLKKKGDMPFFNITIIIAIVALVLIFIIFWPRLGAAKDTLFDLLGVGEEKCQETGTSYQKQLQDLRISITKERYEEARDIYELLKSCFSKKENEIKIELINYVKSLTETNIVNPEGFMQFINYLKNVLGSDFNQVETAKFKTKVQEAILKIIQSQYKKVMEDINKAINPVGTKFMTIDQYDEFAKQKFEKLKKLCQEYQLIAYPEIKDKITSDCEAKKKEIERYLITIECLYWKELGTFEQNLGRDWEAAGQGQREFYLVAYMIYTFVIEKYSSYPECKSIVGDARIKRVEVVQAIYKPELLYSNVCNSINKVPTRGKTDEKTRLEVAKYICSYLEKSKISCDPCKPTQNI